MAQSITSMMFIGIIAAFGFTVYYTFRYRREQKPDHRGLMQAKQNISMGVMLVLLSIYPIFVIAGTVGVIVGTIFLLIGFFNVFAGIRNRSTYQARLKS